MEVQVQALCARLVYLGAPTPLPFLHLSPARCYPQCCALSNCVGIQFCGSTLCFCRAWWGIHHAARRHLHNHSAVILMQADMLVSPLMFDFDPRNLLMWYPNQDVLIPDQADCAGCFDEGGITIRNTPAGHAFLDSWLSKFRLGWWHLGPMTTLEETLLESPEIAHAYDGACRKYVLFERLEDFRRSDLGNYIQFRGCAVFHRDVLLGTYRRRTVTKHVRFVDPEVVGLDELHGRMFPRTLFLHYSGYKSAEMLRVIWRQVYPVLPEDSRCWTKPEHYAIYSDHKSRQHPDLASDLALYRNGVDERMHGYPVCFMRNFCDINGHCYFPELRPEHILPIGKRSWDSRLWVYPKDEWEYDDNVDCDTELESTVNTRSMGGYAGHRVWADSVALTGPH